MSRLAKDIQKGLTHALHHAKGKKVKGMRAHAIKVPQKINVKSLRKRLKLTQEGFARAYGFTISAVKDWEQGRRKPERSARILLKIIDHDPDVVDRALAG